ncbi:MAG TPA: TonB-dependent receptor [Caulobacteraceae bacterium]|nr:TonB-dependent receptor [Caulobacteraceae bacterium]
MRTHKAWLFAGPAMFAAMGMATPGAAQQGSAALEANTVEEVIVTGSLIAGMPKDSPIPVAVIGREELEKRGSPSMVEIMKSMPIMGGVMGESNMFSPASQTRNGGGTINVRGLGPQRTLVLLNGRRFSGYTADTNLIPMAAIGRVEVLKDGAAATYGSDAIGGVANFITRTNFDGIELQADYRHIRGGAGDWSGSAVVGWVGDTANLLLTAGYMHRGELRAIERDWASPAFTTNPSAWGPIGNPGGWTVRAGPGGTGASLGFIQDANCTAVGGLQGFTGATPACYFFFESFNNLVEEQDQYQFYSEFNADIGDTAEFHVEALYTQTTQPDGRSSPSFAMTMGPNGPGGTNAYSVPASNPGFNTFLTQTGNASLIGTAQSATGTLWRPLAFGGNPATGGLGGQSASRKYEEFRVSTNVAGDTGFMGVGYDVGATHITERLDGQITDILIHRLQQALNGLGGPNCTGTTPGANGCLYFNPFSNAFPQNPSLGLSNPGYVPANANSRDLVAWMFDRQVLRQEQKTLVLDAILNGSLFFELPGGPLAWAVGAQYRKINFEQMIDNPNYDARITPCPTPGVTTCTFRTGPYTFLGQNIPLSLEQSVFALYGELNAPVTDSLNLQLAVRYEDYGEPTGSTTNPQLRAKWQATDWLALRGSVGSSFRGPTALNVAPTGGTGLAGIAAAGNNSRSIDFFGNPNVGPETATTYSVGFIVDVGGLSATVDYWNYNLEGQITDVPANVVATAVAGIGNGSQAVNCSHPLRYLITFDNGNVCTQGVTVGSNISRVRSDITNGPTIQTNGVDADVYYRFQDFYGGDLGIGAIVTHVISYEQDPFVYAGVTVSAAYDAAGMTNYDRVQQTIAQWRGQLYANYEYGIHNLNWTLNTISGVDDNRGPTVVQTGASTNCTVANARAGTATNCQLTTSGLHVEPFITHDLTYRVRLPQEVTVTASVMNVLDRDPSAARLASNYDPYIGNPLGRTFKLSVKKVF